MTKPSWQDFGTHDESAHPQLWDGVVSAWCPSLGPTGSRLHDMSGRSNWGTLTNMDNATDWVVDGGQYALDFDGSNDYVSVGTGVNVLLESRVTISAWLKIRTYSSTQAIVSNVDGSGSRLTFNFEFGRQANKFSFLSTNAIDFFSTGTVSDAAWHHVIVSRDGVSTNWRFELALDGKFETATSANAIGSSPGALAIGRLGDVNFAYANMIFGDVVIWNRALSANEKFAVYSIGRAGMYERKRRTIRRLTPEQAGFRPYWALNRNQTIGGGLR